MNKILASKHQQSTKVLTKISLYNYYIDITFSNPQKFMFLLKTRIHVSRLELMWCGLKNDVDLEKLVQWPLLSWYVNIIMGYNNRCERKPNQVEANKHNNFKFCTLGHTNWSQW